MSKRDTKLVIISVILTYLIPFIWNYLLPISVSLAWFAPGVYLILCDKRDGIEDNFFLKIIGLFFAPIFVTTIFFAEEKFRSVLKSDIENLLGVESIQFQWPIKFTKKIAPETK